MTSLPSPFLFRYAFPVERLDALPRSGKKLLDLPAECALENPSALLGRAQPFGELRVAWNDGGFGVSATVAGKKVPLAANLRQPAEADGLQVWIDTRNTQSIHRAGRYCHHFCLLPAASGSGKIGATVIQMPIARAREETPFADAGRIRTRADATGDGYRLEAWFPAETLHGFDPEASPRLGFYYMLRDAELGEQHLTVGPEFPFAHDPSLWSTLELVG
ncbi:MAG: hypothetical protein WD069_08155 [Planctomycetales bacterium]